MTTVLKIENLTLARNTCKNLQLDIQAGEIWGILGPNGSGKTTLLHTLAGLEKPLSGQIFLCGNALKKLSRQAIAKDLGILFQTSHDVFPLSLFDYCHTGQFPHGTNDADLTRHALASMDLLSKAHHSIKTLSGGERRRLSIAALLTQAPQVYLLDEPTNHLDLRHQLQTLHHFSLLAKKNACIVMALHDIHLAQQFCHKMILLFTDGTYLVGNLKETLTEENLTRLYQHSLQSCSSEGKIFWLPKTCKSP